MTNLKLSSKMHLFIVISSVVLAIGLAIGLICQFVGGGFFNYGGDYSSYKTLTVNYALTDYDESLNEEKIRSACEEAFKENGISAYTSTAADTTKGGEIEYRFGLSVTEDSLSACASKISATLALTDKSGLSSVTYNNEIATVINAGKIVAMCSIALGVAVVLQFLYYVIRYKFTMALAALLANVHNLLLFLALLAITRVQITSAIVVYAALTVLLTMICSAFFFDKVRKNAAAEQNKRMSAFELVDMSAGNAFFVITFACVAMVAAVAVIAVASLLGSMSLASMLMPVLCIIPSFIVCFYGSVFFTPSVYSRFRQMADKAHASDYSKQINAD